MKSFEVEHGTPEEFVHRVRRELSASGLDQYVELAADDSELVVRVRWMGSTELHYRLESIGDGFRSILRGERVSPFHAPFRHAFDERLDAVLANVGAKSLNV